MRVAPGIVLRDDERAKPSQLSHSQMTSVRLALRAPIVLLVAEGIQNHQIAE